MGRPSFREKLVSSGVDTIHARGFATVGLREITTTAGVAQGSFTNHFASKEAFGVAVLNAYFDKIRGVIGETLRYETRAPIARLRAYFEAITTLSPPADGDMAA